jgi:hypothetical protein
MEGLLVLFLMIYGAWLVPPLILFVVGWWRRKRYARPSKPWYIAGVVWLLIGGGICASILAG